MKTIQFDPPELEMIPTEMREIVENLKGRLDLEMGDYSEKALADLRRFGPFEFVSQLGMGAEGVVLRAKSTIGRDFAVKLVKYTPYQDRDSNGITKLRSRWWNEVTTMACLHHPNIVGIWSAGLATFTEDQGWKLAEGNPEGVDSNFDLAYIVMDVIEEGILEVFPPEDPFTQDPTQASISERFDDFLDHSIRAIEQCHTNRVCHGDIHINNIRFAQGSRFVLMDFGLMESTKHRPVSVPEKATSEEEKFRQDIRQLLDVFVKVLDRVSSRISRWRARGLAGEIETLRHPENTPFEIEKIRQKLSPFLRVKGWTLDLQLGKALVPSAKDGFIFDSKVRIPHSGSILIFENARKIIDSAPFQRLRHVKQLGPTSYVFPGATHTRFEHTLGVFHLCCRYLERLTSLEVFANEVGDVSLAIRTVVAAALLHDVGHYPFSHWVEELGAYSEDLELPSHEERVRDIINHSELKDILEKKWRVSVDSVCQIISNGKLTRDFEIVGSILSSSLDCDKLDYLVRDSLHCGVDYGKGIDVDRFIDSLYVNRIPKVICVTTKGRASVMGLMFCRNTMYREVYWHKTVRCYMGIFKRVFYDYSRLPSFSKRRTKILDLGDTQFLEEIYKALKPRSGVNPIAELLDIFRGGERNPYKIVFSFQDSPDHSYPAETGHLFRRILKFDNYSEILRTAEIFARAFSDMINFPPVPNKGKLKSMMEYHVIVEVTPKKDSGMTSHLEELKLFDVVEDREVSNSGEDNVLEALNHYLMKTRQVYLCVHKDYATPIRGFMADEKKRRSLFKRVDEVLSQKIG
jgi:serine/threonine protein kinase